MAAKRRRQSIRRAGRDFRRCRVCGYLYPAKMKGDPSSGYAWHVKHERVHGYALDRKAAWQRVEKHRAAARKRLGFVL